MYIFRPKLLNVLFVLLFSASILFTLPMTINDFIFTLQNFFFSNIYHKVDFFKKNKSSLHCSGDEFKHQLYLDNCSSLLREKKFWLELLFCAALRSHWHLWNFKVFPLKIHQIVPVFSLVLLKKNKHSPGQTTAP